MHELSTPIHTPKDENHVNEKSGMTPAKKQLSWRFNAKSKPSTAVRNAHKMGMRALPNQRFPTLVGLGLALFE